jgi:hypothetical protein
MSLKTTHRDKLPEDLGIAFPVSTALLQGSLSALPQPDISVCYVLRKPMTERRLQKVKRIARAKSKDSSRQVMKAEYRRLQLGEEMILQRRCLLHALQNAAEFPRDK